MCDRYCYFMRKKIQLEKDNKKTETQYIWEALDVIPLFPLVEVNHPQPILHISKRMVHIYYIDDIINQFAIGYMINPSLHVNKVFI